MIRLLIFDMASFSPTQGQWWEDLRNDNTERRVSLVASQMGFFLWTADFREARSGKIICQKFFCTKPDSEEPVALFEHVQDRQEWLEKEWAKQAV
jgi:hypothetical protein